MLAHEDECRAAGIDPAEASKLARRFKKCMDDAERLGLSVFGGGGGLQLRYRDDDFKGPLIIADGLGDNCDGGDGATKWDDAGLLRGEY